MVVAVFYFELHLPGLKSLKEKRSIINSLKQRLKNNLNISISEVEHQSLRQRGGIAIAAICHSSDEGENLFRLIYEKISTGYPVQIISAEKEIS